MWLGQALSYNGDGHLAVMGHKAGIEQVTGHRLGSGCGYGSGDEFKSFLRLSQDPKVNLFGLQQDM